MHSQQTQSNNETYIYVDSSKYIRYLQVMPDGKEITNKAVFELLDGNIPVIKVMKDTVLLVTTNTDNYALSYDGVGITKQPLYNYIDTQSVKVEIPDSIPDRVYGEFVPFHFDYDFVSPVMSRICALFNSIEEGRNTLAIRSPFIREGFTYEPVIKLQGGMGVEIRIGTLFRTTSKYGTYAVTKDGLVPVFAVVEEWPIENIMGVVDGIPKYDKNQYSSSEHDFPEGTKLFVVVPKNETVVYGPGYEKATSVLSMSVGNVVYVREPTKEYVIIEMDCNRTSFSAEHYFKYGDFDLISL